MSLSRPLKRLLKAHLIEVERLDGTKEFIVFDNQSTDRLFCMEERVISPVLKDGASYIMLLDYDGRFIDPRRLRFTLDVSHSRSTFKKVYKKVVSIDDEEVSIYEDFGSTAEQRGNSLIVLSLEVYSSHEFAVGSGFVLESSSVLVSSKKKINYDTDCLEVFWVYNLTGTSRG